MIKKSEPYMFTPTGKLKRRYRNTVHVKYRRTKVTVILRGREQLERIIIPQLSKAISGCIKHGETDLARMLQRWKDEAIEIVYPSASLPVQSAPKPAQSNGAVSADPDSIDPELDLMVKTLSNLISHATPEELLAEAAKQLQLGRTPADVEHDFLRDDGE